MKKQQGLTLIEIMIALGLGIFIIAATLTVYINTIKSSSDTIKSARLNHDLGMAMTLMTNDIKRAGYWSGAVVKANILNNPFIAATRNIQIFNLASPTTALTAAAGDCILYSYDANNNGGVNANEYYGFRLNNGVIQMRLSGTTTADCSDGTWEAITEGNMLSITSLQFSFAPLAAAAATATVPAFPALTGTSRCLNFSTSTTTAALTCATMSAGNYIAQKRVVNIRVAGQLIGADNAEVIKGLSNTVRVRNDRIFVN